MCINFVIELKKIFIQKININKDNKYRGSDVAIRIFW